jgi:hypothetical protein
MKIPLLTAFSGILPLSCPTSLFLRNQKFIKQVSQLSLAVCLGIFFLVLSFPEMNLVKFLLKFLGACKPWARVLRTSCTDSRKYNVGCRAVFFRNLVMPYAQIRRNIHRYPGQWYQPLLISHFWSGWSQNLQIVHAQTPWNSRWVFFSDRFQ